MAWRKRRFFRSRKGWGKRRKKWIQRGGSRAAVMEAMTATAMRRAMGALSPTVAPDISREVAAR